MAVLRRPRFVECEGALRLNRRRISQAKPRQIDGWLRFPTIGLVFSHDVGVNPAADIPACGDTREARLDGRDDFVEHVVGDFFVKRTDVSETPHEHLERLELDACLVGDVLDGEVREVRLARQRAMAGELRNLNVNQIIPTRMRVGERVKLGLRF